MSCGSGMQGNIHNMVVTCSRIDQQNVEENSFQFLYEQIVGWEKGDQLTKVSLNSVCLV